MNRKSKPGALINVIGNNALLDLMLERMNLKNDAQVSRALNSSPPIVSKIRHGVAPVGPALLIRMHEASGVSIADLKYVAAGGDL